MDFAAPADHSVKLKESDWRINTSTLLRNWKNCRRWKWQLYQLQLVLLVQSPQDWHKDRRTWKWEDEWRPSKLLHYWHQPEKSPRDWEDLLSLKLETWGDLLSLKLQWKTISWRWCKKLSANNNDIITIRMTEREDHSNPKRPPQRNCPKQLLTHCGKY